MISGQLYSIPTAPWIVSVGNNRGGKWKIGFRHFLTKKDALIWARTRKGYAQLFKADPKFLKAWPVGLKKVGKKKR